MRCEHGQATIEWVGLVSVEGSGFAGRLMSRAADTLLAAGVLDSTMTRIAREAEAEAPVALAA